MAHHVIKKGLSLPITGEPEQRIDAAKPVARVALVAADYVGMRPAFRLKVGDAVKRGTVVFENKKEPGVLLTAPGAGTIAGIHRGERRALQSVVIDLHERERTGNPADEDFQAFEAFTGKDPALLERQEAKNLLIESGLWTAFRTRPFSKTPPVEAVPHAIFVTAMDTNPHAPSMDVICEGRDDDLRLGALVVSKLTDGKAYWCTARDIQARPPANSGFEVVTFEGPHPSGLAGTHIHLLAPASRKRVVWTIGLQDVLAIGALFRDGKLDVQRVVALAGPTVKKPRLLRTRLGAALDELVNGELEGESNRVISGSLLSGRKAMGDVHGFLGRFSQQVSALHEGYEREFLGWIAPGFRKYSLTRAFISALNRNKKIPFTTSTNGSPRAMVPIGLYEKVMPLDILPTHLLRSLVVNDLERAEKLGCLELDEEDLALCTFVCPGKTEYGPILRRNLDTIEKEG